MTEKITLSQIDQMRVAGWVRMYFEAPVKINFELKTMQDVAFSISYAFTFHGRQEGEMLASEINQYLNTNEDCPRINR